MSEDISSIEAQLNVGLEERIKIWNGLLEGADSPEQFKLTFDESIGELDNIACEKFGVRVGEPCIVSGNGFWSETVVVDSEDITTSGVLDRRAMASAEFRVNEGDVASKPGVFMGFDVEVLGDDDKPRLWYIFSLGGIQYKAHKLTTDTKLHWMYIDPKDATITPVIRFEEPYVVDDTGVEVLEDGLERLSELSIRSNTFEALLNSKRFRRLKRSEQADYVDDFIRETEAATGIRNTPATVRAEYGYITEPNQETGDIQRSIISLRGLVLRGTCLAVGMTGREDLDRSPIRKEEDLYNKYEGLCLSIEVKDDSELGPYSMVKPNSIVHVPLSNQQISMGFQE